MPLPGDDRELQAGAAEPPRPATRRPDRAPPAGGRTAPWTLERSRCRPERCGAKAARAPRLRLQSQSIPLPGDDGELRAQAAEPPRPPTRRPDRSAPAGGRTVPRTLKGSGRWAEGCGTKAARAATTETAVSVHPPPGGRSRAPSTRGRAAETADTKVGPSPQTAAPAGGRTARWTLERSGHRPEGCAAKAATAPRLRLQSQSIPLPGGR